MCTPVLSIRTTREFPRGGMTARRRNPIPSKPTSADRFRDFARPQSEMMALDWGNKSLVVLHKGHGEEKPLQMGCPVCIGIAHGSTVFRRPLQATGSADYFGPLANLTARVAGQAHQSQVLLESCSFSRQHAASIQAGQTVKLQHYGSTIHVKPGTPGVCAADDAVWSIPLFGLLTRAWCGAVGALSGVRRPLTIPRKRNRRN